MKKRFLSVIMITSLCFMCLIGGAYAASNNETISALLNRGIKITLNGTEQEFKDVTGTRVYPISYQGTTYLPVRAVSELVDLSVDWDGANNTVVLANKEVDEIKAAKEEDVKKDEPKKVEPKKVEPKKVEAKMEEKAPKNLVDMENTEAKYSKESSYIINDPDMLKFTSNGKEDHFDTGIVFETRFIVDSDSARMFDCANYNEISFSAVIKDVDCEVKVYDENGNIITKFDLKGGILQNKTIKLNGAKKIGFVGSTSAKNENLYIYDPILK